MKKLLMMLLGLILILPSIRPSAAQTSVDDLPRFAAVKDGNLFLYNFADEPIQVTYFEHASFQDIAFSPDGQTIVFSVFDLGTSELDEPAYGIWMTDIQGSPPVKLKTTYQEWFWEFPLVFSEDGQLLTIFSDYYNRESRVDLLSDSQFITDYRFESGAIYKTPLEADAVSEEVALLPFSPTCGGGSNPLFAAYQAEKGSDYIFQATTNGYLVTLGCSYGIGITHGLDGSWEFVGWLDEPSVSPDGTHIAGIDQSHVVLSNYSNYDPGPLVMVDIATKTTTELRVAPSPDDITVIDNIHWSADGNIYYVLRTPTGFADVSDEDLQQINFNRGGFIDGVPVYEISVMQLNPETGEEKVVYQSSDYGVPRFTDYDGQVLMSVVPNMNQWLAAFQAGEVDVGFYHFEDATFFPTTLVRFSPDDESAAGDVVEFKLLTLYPAP